MNIISLYILLLCLIIIYKKSIIYILYIFYIPLSVIPVCWKDPFWILGTWGGPPAADLLIVNPHTVPWLTIAKKGKINFQNIKRFIWAGPFKKIMLNKAYIYKSMVRTMKKSGNCSQNTCLTNSLYNLLLYYINNIDYI